MIAVFGKSVGRELAQMHRVRRRQIILYDILILCITSKFTYTVLNTEEAARASSKSAGRSVSVAYGTLTKFSKQLYGPRRGIERGVHGG